MTSTSRSVQIYMLGPFRVVVDDVPVDAAAWRSKKAQTLLKYLVAHRGKPVHRDELLELLWPTEHPDTAVGRLYTTLHLLRRAVEPDLPRYGESVVVRSGGGRYWCDADSEVWVDSEAFVALYEQATALEATDPEAAWDRWQQCLALYGGNFLEENGSDEWTMLPREALLDKFVDGTLRAARLQYELTGDPEPSVRLCRNGLVHDRYREELYQGLIAYLLSAKRHGEAIQQYRQLRTLLQDEFALEPSAATEALLREHGIDPMEGMAGNTSRVSKLVQRLPMPDVPTFEPAETDEGPLVMDGASLDALITWNERLSARYLTSFAVLTVRETPAPAGAPDRLFQDLLTQLRNSDVVGRDEWGIRILLPYMDRMGARVVVRRLRCLGEDVGWRTMDIDVRVVSGRELALTGSG